MAEALGVAASVSGLITIADIVVRRGYAFIKDVKDAGETVEKLILEVNLLFATLHSLQVVVERLEDASNVDPTMQIHWIEPCYQTLLKIQGHLQKAMAGNSMTKTEKFKWPLRKSATLELLGEIERHKSNITIALNAKEMSALCNIRDGMQILKTAFDAERTARKKIVVDDKRHEMLQLLGTISARKWQDSNIRLRQPGTGIWFTTGAEFNEWLSEERSKLWINGIAGAGKTVLMSSTIQKIELELKTTEALAFFYCDYKDSSTHSASTILGSLARQLIMRREDCFDDLTTFYEEHVSPDRSIRTPSPEELCQLISKLSTRFDTVMIVVDGLDEITHGRADVSRLLASLIGTSPSIKTLFSSRPEIDIGHVLNDFHTISIAAQSSDIRLYIASEIERRTADMRLEINDPNLKEYIMTTLADRCDGMFRWVACQMDYLCECSNDRDRREALTKLPPDLPSSYERILDRLNRSTKENQSLVKEALYWISYADTEDEYFTTKHLLQALAVREGDTAFDSSRMTTERRLLHWCSSLVRKNPASGSLELAHFTVEEFLQATDPLGNPSFVQYRLSGDHSILAKTCIRLLRCETFDGKTFPHPPARTDEVDDTVDLFCDQYPFFSYAAITWSYHVHKSTLEEIDETVLELFTSPTGPTFQRMAAVWHCLSRGVRTQHVKRKGIPAEAIGFQAQGMNSTHVSENNMWPSPLNWAAWFALDRVCPVLIDNGADINRQSILGTPLYCYLMPQRPYYDLDYVLNGYPVWFDLLSCFRGFGELRVSQRGVAFKTLLRGGASTNIPASPDRVETALDLAIQIVRESVEELSCRGYFFMELLRSGARLTADNLDIVISEVLTPVTDGAWSFGDDERVWVLTEAAVRAKWHLWSHEHLACLFGITFSRTWVHTAHQIERLRMAIEETFQDATLSELKSILHIENGDCSTPLARAILRTFELSCETSQAFSHAMGSVLSRILEMNSPDVFGSAFILLSSCPGVVDVDVQDEATGKSPLHMCLEAKFCDEADVQSFTKVLLRRGASVISIDRDGVSALDLAARTWNLQMFKLLWESTSFVQSRDTSHDLVNRILYGAISREDTELTDFLMAEMGVGPQPDCASFLTFSIGQSEIDTICQVLAECANYPWMWNIANECLRLAEQSKFSSVLVRSFFDLQTSVNAHGNTLAHRLAAVHGKISRAKLKLLLALGQSYDDRNDDGFSPLALAVRCKNLLATKILLEADANPHQPLARGQTVLHLAAFLGNTEAVEMILERSTYQAIKDDSGMTAEQLALACGHDRIATMIRNAVSVDDGMDVTEGMSPDNGKELHDPHGKLPLRLVDCNSGFPALSDSGPDGPTDSSQSRNSPEDTRSPKMESPKIPLEISRLEATTTIVDAGSSKSDISDMHIFGSDGRFASKRQFQSLDSAFLEPAGKKSRQI